MPGLHTQNTLSHGTAAPAVIRGDHCPPTPPIIALALNSPTKSPPFRPAAAYASAA